MSRVGKQPIPVTAAPRLPSTVPSVPPSTVRLPVWSNPTVSRSLSVHCAPDATVAVLVIIGPTHPGYTRVDYPPLGLLCDEVACWPCHLKRCPIDFRCMHQLTAARVLAAARRHLAGLEVAA